MNYLKRFYLVVINIIQLTLYINAQSKTDTLPPSTIQAEINIGYRKTLISTIVNKKIDAKKKFNFISLSAIHSFYSKEDRRFDEIFANTAVTYNYIGPFSAGAGIKFVNTTGPTPFLAVQFTKRSSHYFITLLLSYMVLNIPLREAIFQFNYRFRLTRDYRLFTQFLATTSWQNFEMHRRSQQQFRLGLDRNSVQYGIGIDVDQYGRSNIIVKTNIGLFLRKEFR